MAILVNLLFFGFFFLRTIIIKFELILICIVLYNFFKMECNVRLC